MSVANLIDEEFDKLIEAFTLYGINIKKISEETGHSNLLCKKFYIKYKSIFEDMKKETNVIDKIVN